MLFNSYIFIFIFFPLCIVGYFLLNHFEKYKAAMVYLLCMSLWFYGYNNYYYLFVIIGSILINYFIYRGITRFDKYKKLLMIFGVGCNLCALGYFKYMDFFISNFNLIFKTDISLLKIALPLGISFFTFQQISFIVDAYKGEIPGYDFITYACFVAYFPQLIAGPIVTHDEMVPQFMDRTKKHFNADNFSKGLFAFVIGMSKKLLVADAFSPSVIRGFSIVDEINAPTAILTALSYTIQIYFDFSGYCDMALGIAKMMNIDLPINFNSPYKAVNISDFWKRWHITLTRFFTKYVYIPLGGNRKGLFITCLNTLFVFLLSGFWHGANWTFVVWGLLHGIALVIYRLGRKLWDKLPKVIGWIFTFVYVMLAWVFFRAESLSQAIKLIKRMFIGGWGPIDEIFYQTFRYIQYKKIISMIRIENYVPCIIMILFFMVALAVLLLFKNTSEKIKNFKLTIFRALATSVLLVWCIFSLSVNSEFLYFNF